jgi:hypothetical protein
MQQTLSRQSQRPRGVTIVALALAIHGILDVLLGVIILAGVFALGHAISTQMSAGLSACDCPGKVQGSPLAAGHSRTASLLFCGTSESYAEGEGV